MFFPNWLKLSKLDAIPSKKYAADSTGRLNASTTILIGALSVFFTPFDTDDFVWYSSPSEEYFDGAEDGLILISVTWTASGVWRSVLNDLFAISALAMTPLLIDWEMLDRGWISVEYNALVVHSMVRPSAFGIVMTVFQSVWRRFHCVVCERSSETARSEDASDDDALRGHSVNIRKRSPAAAD